MNMNNLYEYRMDMNITYTFPRYSCMQYPPDISPFNSVIIGFSVKFVTNVSNTTGAAKEADKDMGRSERVWRYYVLPQMEIDIE